MKRGFTVAELLVATAVAGIAAAFMTMTIVRQQRFFSSAAEVLGVRAQMRDGADVLVSDIRSASVQQFGLPVMADTAVELYVVTASSVVCTTPAPDALGLPPAVLAAGHTLTSILNQPDTGDVVAAFDSDSLTWSFHRIAAFASRSITAACPPSSGLTTAGDELSGSSAYLATLAAAPATPLATGSPVRFLRRVRYSFYRSSDGDWYLGYRRCSHMPPNGCGSIQPVSGPYRRHSSSSGASGVEFRYYDQSGAPVTSAPQSYSVARIDIVLRGESASPIALVGDSRRVWRDSIIVSVSPRNRRR